MAALALGAATRLTGFAVLIQDPGGDPFLCVLFEVSIHKFPRSFRDKVTQCPGPACRPPEDPLPCPQIPAVVYSPNGGML